MALSFSTRENFFKAIDVPSWHSLRSWYQRYHNNIRCSWTIDVDTTNLVDWTCSGCISFLSLLPPLSIIYNLPRLSCPLLFPLFSLTHSSRQLSQCRRLLHLLYYFCCHILSALFFFLDIILMQFISFLLSAAQFCLLNGAPLAK